jgi:hypothetical protein
MVNGNHLQFDRKSFFNFWKTIYDFQNSKSFFKIKLFVLTRTFVKICHCWASKGEVWQRPAIVAGFRQNLARFRPNLARFRQWLEASRIWPKWLSKIRQRRPDVAEFLR